ncbi:MAG TPA: ATP-binding protein [Nitrospiria bacterium]|nr:ATP-binding protein [Nitrospiria bacterium]
MSVFKNISIKTKLLLLTITSVVAILFASNYFTQSMIEKNAEANLRQETENVVKEIDSAVATVYRNLTNIDEINEDLMDMITIHSDIERIDLYSFSPEGMLLPVTSKMSVPHPPASLSQDDIDKVNMNQILYKPERIGKVNYVNVISPFHLKSRVIGLIQMKLSRKEYDRLQNEERSHAFVITLLSVLMIGGLFAVSMTRMIHRPIENLLKAMARVKAGDLTVSIFSETQDELGRLTQSFNSMIQTIKQTAEANQALLGRIHTFNEELQNKIDAATEELQTRNDELTRANRSIYQMQKQLLQSNELAAIGQLAATVAHELGTPLHSVFGHLQLLLVESGLSEDARRRLSIMQSQLERLINSIRQLLNTTRYPETDFDWIELNVILDDLCVLFSPETIAKQITVVKELDPNLPKLLASHSQMQGVFLNLIDNAIDELSGGGTLRIRTKRTTLPIDASFPAREEAAKTDWVEVTVQDNGRGIPPDQIQKIFEPFFTSKDPGQGSGLGLSICRDIVQRHGGTISVESRLTEGSRFIVRLPVRKRG